MSTTSNQHWFAKSTGGISGIGFVAGTVPFRVTKRATPGVSLYGNNSGNWHDSATDTWPATAVHGAAGYISINGFMVVTTAVATDGLSGHWAASSEL
jgi:hypothetical protein